jgi:hypothetical protein
MVAEEAGLQLGEELDGVGQTGSALPTGEATAAAAPNDLEARLAALRK